MQQSFQQPQQQSLGNAPVQGAVQENQLEQELSQTPIQNDPNWPTDFSNSAKNGASQPASGQAEAVQQNTPAQPSAAAAVGTALVKTLGAVMVARSANNMYGGSPLSRMMGGNSMMGNPMMGGMGGMGGMMGNPMMGGMMGNPMMGGMGGMGGMMGNPYGYNTNGGMINLLMNKMINR